MRKQTILDPGVLYFGRGNSKLVADNVATFTLPAGYTCPGAMDCLAKFDRKKRKLVDGPKQKFRCFAASTEASRTTVRVSTDRNWQRLKTARTVENMTALIRMSLPPTYWSIVRVHVGGDFYSLDYMMAWFEAARQEPTRLFYAYTKSLDVWVKLRHLQPDNFVMTASRGGRHDHLIDQYDLRESIVFFHPEDAEAAGVPMDHEDNLAMDRTVHKFGLLIHNNGAPGSEHSKAVKRLKKENIKFSYGRKK